MGEWDYTIASVCLDKKAHLEKYRNRSLDPYHYCLEILLERYLFFLEKVESVGDVMAESRNRRDDMRLKNVYQGIWRRGTYYVPQSRFQAALTSRELKVKPKFKNVAGLQVADLLAHPSRCEILSEAALLPRGLSPFERKVIEVLGSKYYQKGGFVRGSGKKLLP